MNDRAKVLYFDIETTPCMAWVWSTGKQYVGADQILEPPKIICIAYKWEGKGDTAKVLSWDKGDDKAMLQKFSKVAVEADCLVGHNGKSFDLRHINARVAFHKLLPLPVSYLEDTLQLTRRALRLPSHKLSYLATYFGLGGKLETGGSQLWLDVMNGSKTALAKMEAYCKQDVVLLEKVFERLKAHLPTKFNRSIISGTPGKCPSCGGTTIKYGYHTTTSGKRQRYHCVNCGKNSSDGKNLMQNSSEYLR